MANPSHTHRRRLKARWVLFLLVAVSQTEVNNAQTASAHPSHVLVEGEELVYNVRYAFIDLGQVKIRVLKKMQTPDYSAYHAIANISSYKGVPFVDLAAIYESDIDSGVYSHAFVGKSKENKVWDFARYKFEYDNKRVLIDKGRKDTIVERRDTVMIDRHMQDGLSLFFYARDQLFSKKRMNIPCFVTEQKVNTYIDFRGERKSVDLDAVDYLVDVVGFDGTAEFVGIYGLTGDFEGWFSNDEARIPIVAKMKVIIGSVTLELMSWKRPGWMPPRAAEN
ncbi:MAG: hypothetical protein HW412_365 [Bacteroidetes bacterium]|nr:hypothetical protein [Bacteroidota bacterium]